ncbi:MAG: glycosyltransferase family 9 protein [Alphaproteobacteria bacterium]|nr:glycosyltransferase family 9 protein [Alphaproteobacteria bacterium]
MSELPKDAVLVIKLGALGDFVQALGPFAAIRRHHVDAKVTLLTTAPYEDLAKASGFFDDIWTRGRPGTADIGGWLGLHRLLRGGGFGRVYDLQTSDRSSFYYRLFWPGPAPEWSGIANGCSHPHANPDRDFMHTMDRQAEQLSMAGIAGVPAPDLSWADTDISRFGLPERFALLAPGSALHRPGKRWPAGHYGQLAKTLMEKGLVPVLVGSAAEVPIMAGIKAQCERTRDLSGQTGLLDLAALGRGAEAAVGNDNGPMHLFSSVGCRTVVLYSHVSDPALCGQRGAAVTILRRESLGDLSVAEVMDGMGL